MPVLGLGTWRMSGHECEETVKLALEMGYRHIDTAELYMNEVEIGRAIKGFGRSKLFIVSKVWMSNLHRKDLLDSCAKSLERLGTPYVDLYLLHWPNDSIPIKETMVAMGELVDHGMARSIGISNFDIRRTQEAIDVSPVPVSVNQVEFHPYLYQSELLGFCKKHGIVLTAYCPVARGGVLDDHTLAGIAEKYGKTPAQVSLRWLVQHGTTVIPKSTNPKHLKENMDVFDWRLSKGDMEKIDSISIEKRLVNPILTKVPFFASIADKFVKWNTHRKVG
jgi:diketogulonate reductase-like aldo/keto reductase